MKAGHAAEIAARAHVGEKYGELAYIEHVIDVVDRVNRDPLADDDAKVVAWLHDVLENTKMTVHDLKAQGLTKRQQEALCAITRGTDGDLLRLYPPGFMNSLAALVKYHDLRSNLAQPGKPHLVDRYSDALPEVAIGRLGARDRSSR